MSVGYLFSNLQYSEKTNRTMKYRKPQSTGKIFFKIFFLKHICEV
jgi:hypothetical protein